MKKHILILGVLAFVSTTLFVSCSNEEDTLPPSLTLDGSNPYVLENIGDSYVEPGYTAVDDEDGNITNNVVVTNDLNKNLAGTYEFHYTVSDAAGNSTDAHREVIVQNSLETNTSYKGIYSVSEVCGGGPGTYNDTLFYSNSVNNRIWFTRFGNYLSGAVYADINVAGGTVTVPMQNVVCGQAPAPSRQFSGSGVISVTGGVTTMVINYTEVTNGTSTSCTGTYTK